MQFTEKEYKSWLNLGEIEVRGRKRTEKVKRKWIMFTFNTLEKQ